MDNRINQIYETIHSIFHKKKIRLDDKSKKLIKYEKWKFIGWLSGAFLSVIFYFQTKMSEVENQVVPEFINEWLLKNSYYLHCSIYRTTRGALIGSLLLGIACVSVFGWLSCVAFNDAGTKCFIKFYSRFVFAFIVVEILMIIVK